MAKILIAEKFLATLAELAKLKKSVISKKNKKKVLAINVLKVK